MHFEISVQIEKREHLSCNGMEIGPHRTNPPHHRQSPEPPAVAVDLDSGQQLHAALLHDFSLTPRHLCLSHPNFSILCTPGCTPFITAADFSVSGEETRSSAGSSRRRLPLRLHLFFLISQTHQMCSHKSLSRSLTLSFPLS